MRAEEKRGRGGEREGGRRTKEGRKEKKEKRKQIIAMHQKVWLTESSSKFRGKIW